MAGKSDAGLLREMHGDVKVLISEVTELKEHVEHQNGHIDELMRFKIGTAAALRTLGVITSGSLAVAGLAVAVATGLL